MPTRLTSRAKGFLLGTLLGVTVLSGTVTSQSCTSLPIFNPATGTLSTETELVPLWKVDEREEQIFAALEDHGKIKVIRVKEENPVVAWVFGAGLAIGGVMMLLGIAFVWLTKGVKWIEGMLISGCGLSTFVTFYLIETYLLWICLGYALAFVGSLAYIFIFKKDMLEKLVSSFEKQKDQVWSDEIGEQVKSAQGSKQAVIAKIRKKVLK